MIENFQQVISMQIEDEELKPIKDQNENQDNIKINLDEDYQKTPMSPLTLHLVQRQSFLQQNDGSATKRSSFQSTHRHKDSKFFSVDFNLSTYEERKQLRLIETLYKEPSCRKSEEIDSMIQQTHDIQFFQNLISQGNSDIHRRCCQKMRYEFYPANQLIFKIGTYGNKFYIIIDGKVGVYIRNIIDYSKKSESKQVVDSSDPRYEQVGGLHYFTELQTGKSFGELALLERKPRAASILSHTDVHLGVLVKEDFDDILKNYEEYKLYLAAQFFDQVPPFSKWNQRRQINLHLNTTKQVYQINQTVYEEDSEPNAFYIIKSGTFAVMKKKVNKPKNEEYEKGKEDANSVVYDPQNKTQQKAELQFKLNQSQKYNLNQSAKKKKSTQKSIKRPFTQQNKKITSKSSSLSNLTPAQFQQYQLYLQQEQQTTESDEEDEQDILLKKHDLFGIKQKDAKFQKPIMVKVAELGEFSSFGDEEIIMKCKSRIFSVVCTSAHGELIAIAKRDFELRVLTDYSSRVYYKEQILQKDEFYRSQLEKIGLSINSFNNYFFDSKLELNREKLTQIQVEKTTSNRDLESIKKFIIGVDYIDEVANNIKLKNRRFERIANNELCIDDLINGTFIQDSQKNSPQNKDDQQELEKSNINIIEKEKPIINDISKLKNDISQFEQERKNSCASQVHTLYPSSDRDELIEIRDRNISDLKYKSQKIITPDGISVCVQNEYQIADELMHQTIQGLVKNKIEKKNEENQVQTKSSAYRNSVLLDTQLKKYKIKDTTQSVPVSPNISPRPSLTMISNSIQKSSINDIGKKQFNDENKIEESKLVSRSKGGFWNLSKTVVNASKLNNNTVSLVAENGQMMNSKSQDSKIEQSNIQTPKSKPKKKKWVDSYTISFQETLKRNMMEKFKDPKLNAARLKQHLKQKAISQIPNDDFANIPDTILKKATIVVPEMDEKIKLFQRAVTKNFGIQKLKSTSFIKDLSEKIKQNRVMSIHDGFLSHLQSSIQKPEQNELSPQNSPYFRTNSIKDQTLQTNQSINFKDHSTESKLLRFNSTVSTLQSHRDEVMSNNNGFLSTQVNPQRRLNSAHDQNSVPYFQLNSNSQNIFSSLSSPNKSQMGQKRMNSAGYQFQNTNNASHHNIYSNTYSIYNKGNIQNKNKFQNSPKGYSFYENQSKKLYISRMKSKSINMNLSTPKQQKQIIYSSIQKQNSIQNLQNKQKINDSHSNSQLLNGYEQNINADVQIKNNSQNEQQIMEQKQQFITENDQQQIVENNNKQKTDQQNSTLQIPQVTIKRPSIPGSHQKSQSTDLSIPQSNKHLQIQIDSQKYILKFPSNDTVKEDVSKNDQSQQSLESFALEDGKNLQKYTTPRVFSPAFSPINALDNKISIKDKFVSGFPQKTPFNFKQIFSPFSAGQSPINQNYLKQEIDYLSLSHYNNQNQKNESTLNEEYIQSVYFNNRSDQNDFKDMNFRFKIPEQNNESSNQNINSTEKPYINFINSQNGQQNNTMLNSCLSPANTAVKNMSQMFGNSMSKKQKDQEYDQTLIQKHIQHRKFYSLMTDQLDEDDKNLNVQELRKCYKFQDQNPFFIAQTVDQSTNLSLKNQRKLSQSTDQFQFENELKEQHDLLLKQMNSIQQAEKQLHEQKPKTNSMFLRPQNMQQISLQNIMDMQKNIHKRNKTEIPQKLTTKQTNSPIYKFQVEKLYNDKIRYIKAQQQSEEIQRKNDFFIKIAQSPNQTTQKETK